MNRKIVGIIILASFVFGIAPVQPASALRNPQAAADGSAVGEAISHDVKAASAGAFQPADMPGLIGKVLYEDYLSKFGESAINNMLDQLNGMYDGRKGREDFYKMWFKLQNTKVPHPLPAAVSENIVYKHIPDELLIDFSKADAMEQLTATGRGKIGRTHIVLATAGLGTRTVKSIPPEAAEAVEDSGRLTKPTFPIRETSGESPVILALRNVCATAKANKTKVLVTLVISNETKPAILKDLTFMEGRYIDPNYIDIILVNQNEFPTISDGGNLITEIGKNGKPKMSTNPNGTLGVMMALGETIKLEDLDAEKDGATVEGVRIARRVKHGEQGTTTIHDLAKSSYKTERALFLYGDDSRLLSDPDKLLAMVGATFQEDVDYMPFATDKISMMVPPGGTFVLVEEKDPQTGKVISSWISAYEMNQRTKVLDKQELEVLKQTGRCFYFNAGPAGCTNKVIETAFENFHNFPVHSAFKVRRTKKIRPDGTLEVKEESVRQGEYYLPEVMLIGTPELPIKDKEGNRIPSLRVKLGLWPMDDYGAQKDWARILGLRNLARKEARDKLANAVKFEDPENADVSIGAVFNLKTAGKNIFIGKGGSVHFEGECSIGNNVKITFGPRGGRVIIYGPVTIEDNVSINVDGGDIYIISNDDNTHLQIGKDSEIAVEALPIANEREVMVIRSDIKANTNLDASKTRTNRSLPHAKPRTIDFAWRYWQSHATFISYLDEDGIMRRQLALPGIRQLPVLLKKKGPQVVGNMLLALALEDFGYYQVLSRELISRGNQRSFGLVPKEDKKPLQHILNDLINQVNFVALYSQAGMDAKGHDKDLQRLIIAVAYNLIKDTAGETVTGLTKKIIENPAMSNRLKNLLIDASAEDLGDVATTLRGYLHHLTQYIRYNSKRRTLSNTIAAFYSEGYRELQRKIGDEAAIIDYLSKAAKLRLCNFAELLTGDYLNGWPLDSDLTENGLFARSEYLRSISGVRWTGQAVKHINLREKFAVSGDGFNMGRRWMKKSDKDEIIIVLSRDSRPKAEAVSDALKRGILAAEDGGANRKIKIIDLGACPTPIWEYAVWYLGADGGVMVTASHNPEGDIGYKIAAGAHEKNVVSNQGALLPEEAMVELDRDFWGDDRNGGLMNEFRAKNPKGEQARQLINIVNQARLYSDSEETDRLRRKIARGFFIDFVYKGILGMTDDEIRDFIAENKNRHRTVALDLGGGAAASEGTAYKEGLEELGITVVDINSTVGQHLRQPEPAGDATEQLIRLMCERDIPLGGLTDLDADRLILISQVTVSQDVRQALGRGVAMDIEPQLVSAFTLAMRLSQLYLKGEIVKSGDGTFRSKDGRKIAVVAHSFCSEMVKWVARQWDAEVKICEIGEINVVNAMKQWGARGWYVPMGMEPANGGVLLQAINESTDQAGNSELRDDTCRNGFLTIAFASLVQSNPKIYLTWLEILNERLNNGTAGVDLQNMRGRIESLLSQRDRIKNGDYNIYEVTETFPPYYYRLVKLAGLVAQDNQQTIKTLIGDGWRSLWNKYCQDKSVQGKALFNLPEGVTFESGYIEFSEGSNALVTAFTDDEWGTLESDRAVAVRNLSGGWSIHFIDNYGRRHYGGIRYSKTTPSELNEIAESCYPNTEIALTRKGLEIFLEADSYIRNAGQEAVLVIGHGVPKAIIDGFVSRGFILGKDLFTAIDIAQARSILDERRNEFKAIHKFSYGIGIDTADIAIIPLSSPDDIAIALESAKASARGVGTEV